MNDLPLPNGEKIIDANMYEINKAYIDALNNYIGTKVVFPVKDSIPVLKKIIKRKRDNQGNKIGN